VLAVLLALAEIGADRFTWIELNVSIVYSLPLVLAAVTRSRRLLWSLAAALAAMTFAVYALQISPGRFAPYEPYFVNRALSAATLLLTAGLLHVWITVVDALDAQSRLLEQRNAQLEAANAELVVHEEQIARQNEALERQRIAAEEASGRKSRMLAAVSHDIRTPVSAINLLTEVLRRAAADPALTTQIPDLSERLHANAQSLADLLSGVMDAARFDSGQTLVRKSAFTLNELLSGQCSHMQPLAEAKGLRLEVRLPGQTVWLWTDRIKLVRVVSNLVSNAIKYTHTGGVYVETGVDADGSALIRVRDTGIGMDARALQRAFDEFWRLSDETHVESWGLGLAICSRLLDALGGGLSAHSEPGQGTEFVIRLPAQAVVKPFDASAAAGREEPLIAS
jgi:signal transduction histidine kinase